MAALRSLTPEPAPRPGMTAREAARRWDAITRVQQATCRRMLLGRWHFAHDLAIEAGLDPDDAVDFADDDFRHLQRTFPTITGSATSPST